MTNKIKATLYMLNTSLFFSLMTVFIVLSGALPTFEKTLFRNAIAAIFTLFIVIKEKPSFNLPKKAWLALIMRSFFGTIAMFCNFYAFDHMLLADAVMMGRLSPFFALFFSYLFLKEKLTIFHLLFVLLGFLGSSFIIKPQLDFNYLFPYLIAIIGAISSGIAITMIRKSGQLKVEGILLVFFFSTFSTIVNIPLAAMYYIPMHLNQFIYLLLTGLGACIAQISLTKAYFNAPARDISILDYSQLLFAAFFGYLIFNQVPDIHSVIGYIITSLAGIGLFLYNRKRTL